MGDKPEFKKLMDSLQPGRWDDTMVNKVWSKVDKDHSGEVSCEELLAYIFRGDVREDRKQRTQHAQQQQAQAQQGNIAALMQSKAANDAVIVEFVLGPGQEKIVDIITTYWMKNPLLKLNVKVLKKVVPGSNCIQRVSARQG